MSERPITLQPTEEKYWNELKDSEKIERMRLVVKELNREIKEVKAGIRELYRHNHNKDGEPVIVKRLGYDLEERRSYKEEDSKTDVYF